MTEQKNNTRNVLQPLIYALLIAIGLLLGRYISLPLFNDSSFLNQPSGSNQSRKLSDVLNYIKMEYVDTVNEARLVDGSIEKILEQLDPHSAFIPAEDLQRTNEPLEGNFEGIGIEFHIQQDTVMVVSVIQGGPSADVGLMPGDRIVKVDGKNFTGNEVSNNTVMKTLRGVGGSKVKVSVFRRNEGHLLDFTITRGKIPINSIDASYMATVNTGYIRLSRFGATTFEEYLKAFNELRQQGMTQLILDLRGNPGGYMETAVALSDEFLPEGKMIVYTKGRSRPRKEYKATTDGSFESGKIVLLIDEGSASSSEIVAGAMQDWDRATIIGRRSFGKGLVQEQVELPDGSALRLTVSRYYTPSGRSIQKPYAGGYEEYQNELLVRYKHGELENADSVKFADSLKYKTASGRTVYGGGGIMPDIFIPIDTSFRSSFYEEVLGSGLITQFAYDYVDKNRTLLKSFNTVEDFDKGISDQKVLSDFITYAASNKIKGSQADVERCKAELAIDLKAYVARQIFRDNGFYKIYFKRDSTYLKAISLLNPTVK